MSCRLSIIIVLIHQNNTNILMCIELYRKVIEISKYTWGTTHSRVRFLLGETHTKLTYIFYLSQRNLETNFNCHRDGS